jgi:ABC-type transporter Mla maintaining outer membrane lipid asymmetry ATPase subunit MlaF
MINKLDVRDVSVRQGDFEILRELTASFHLEDCTFIVGKAGGGKSTLLKTAAGLIVPDSGAVFFRGKSLFRMSRADEMEFRRVTAFAFQDAALWANQSIYNNLSLPLSLHYSRLDKKEADRRILNAVARVGYTESLSLRPVSLSTGEQKLISLARCLVIDPDVYFMDEPTASLDDESVDRLVDLMKELKASGKSLIVVSHDARLIAELADQLCVVSNGSITGFGPLEKVAPLVGGELIKRIKQARSHMIAEESEDRWR